MTGSHTVQLLLKRGHTVRVLAHNEDERSMRLQAPESRTERSSALRAIARTVCPRVSSNWTVIPVAPVTKVLARLILPLLFRRTPSRSASKSTGTRVRGSHIHAAKAARCLLMNSSSVIGGRPPIFSIRSFVPAKIPF